MISSWGSRPLWMLLILLVYVTARQSSAFDTNKLYKYDFQGAITNKVANEDKQQYSGYSLKASILFKKTNDEEIILKLDQPQLATFNEVINDIHQYKYDYKPIDSSTSLDKAFRVFFNQNEAQSFDTYKDEPRWVSNFKRGLISFFNLKNLNINNNNNNNVKGDEQHSSSSGGNYFSLMEKSVSGECPTDYIVLEGDNELNVTKTRDTTKCKSRYWNKIIPIDMGECYENERDLQQFKHSNAVFNYNLKGNKENFIIERCLLDELSLFAPFGQEAHSHSISTKFMISLVSSEGDSNLSPGDSPIKNEKFTYEPTEASDFYATNNLEKEHHLSDILETRASVEQVMQVFDDLVQEHKTYTSAFDGQPIEGVEGWNYQETSRMALLFMQLNKLIGTLDYQQIEQVYTQADDKGDSHKKIFWDLMSVAGTNPSFMYVKKLITEGYAPSVKIKEFLTKLSFHIKSPSKSLFDEYVGLCRSDKIGSNQPYKRLCLLPLASLIHQHCVKPHGKQLRQQYSAPLDKRESSSSLGRGTATGCQLNTAEEYFQRLVQMDTSELSISDKMFNIKMAGELAIKQSVDYLQQTFKNKNEHPTLRSAAMWNMIKASRIFPSLVKELAIPYYYDQSEALELRIASFYNWLNSGMSLHEMETLVKQLMFEQNRQLVLYMSSLIESMSKLKSNPCMKSMEKNAKLVLPLVRRAMRKQRAGGFFDSSATMTSTWNEEFNYGTATMMSKIISNSSLSSINVFYKTSEIMSGIKLNPMMITIQGNGLDRIIRRFVGNTSLFADKESFLDVFSLKKRAKRQTEESSKPKQATKDFSEVYIAVTLSAYGRQVTFFDIDSKELKRMMSEDGTIKIPHVKKLLHTFTNHSSPHMMINFEKLELFNNEMGLPLFQEIHDFEYKNFKLNSVKLDVEPGFFKDERQGKPPSRITGGIDMKFVRHNEMFISSGALLNLNKQKLGVGFHKKKILNIPLKISLDANLIENKILIKEQATNQESILYIKQTPATFMLAYDPASLASTKLSTGEQTKRWLPLYNNTSPTQMEPYKVDYMGSLALGVKLEGKHKAGQDWSMAAWRNYMNKMGMSSAKFMYFYSPTGQPLEARLSTFTRDENPTKELTFGIHWKHHHYDKNQNQNQEANELTATEKELETYTTGKNGDKPTTVNYQFSLAGGSTTKRKLALDVSYSRSFDRSLHKWRVYYQGAPNDSASQPEGAHMCWNGQLPSADYNLDKLVKYELSDLVLLTTNMTSSDLKFGERCSDAELENAKKVTFKI